MAKRRSIALIMKSTSNKNSTRRSDQPVELNNVAIRKTRRERRNKITMSIPFYFFTEIGP